MTTYQVRARDAEGRYWYTGNGFQSLKEAEAVAIRGYFGIGFEVEVWDTVNGTTQFVANADNCGTWDGFAHALNAHKSGLLVSAY